MSEVHTKAVPPIGIFHHHAKTPVMHTSLLSQRFCPPVDCSQKKVSFVMVNMSSFIMNICLPFFLLQSLSWQQGAR